MAVKDRSGPWRAAQTAKRHFLNSLEKNKPCLYLPFCTASFQMACCILQVAFGWHISGPRTMLQGQSTMALKDGSGPRPAAQTAKRHFLNRIETSFKPCLYLPFCAASFQMACCVGSCQMFSELTRNLASNFAFSCRSALPASKLPAASCRWLSSGTAWVQGRCRRAKTPWQ